MADPKTFRVGNSENPDRLELFEAMCRRNASDDNRVMRQLIDACILYEKENGHMPRWPVRLVPITGEKKKK